MEFTSNLSDNMMLLQDILKADTNFDVVYRTISVGGRTACLYFVDGLTKDEVLLKLLQVFSTVQEKDMPADAHSNTYSEPSAT